MLAVEFKSKILEDIIEIEEQLSKKSSLPQSVHDQDAPQSDDDEIMVVDEVPEQFKPKPKLIKQIQNRFTEIKPPSLKLMAKVEESYSKKPPLMLDSFAYRNEEEDRNRDE